MKRLIFGLLIASAWSYGHAQSVNQSGYIEQALTCSVQARQSFSNGQEFTETGILLVDVLATEKMTQISITSSLSSFLSTFVTTAALMKGKREITDESTKNRWSVKNVYAGDDDGQWTTKVVLDRRSGDLLVSQSLVSQAVIAVTSVSGKCDPIPKANKF